MESPSPTPGSARNPAAPPPLIRAVDLSKVYRSGDTDLVIFENLDLEVPRGEKLALVGE